MPALLERLLAEVERAWRDRGDASAVDRLAAEHPEHAEALYELFAALVLGERPGEIDPELVRRVTERSAVLSFAAFLQKRTGVEPNEIARRVGRVSWAFLAQVSRHPELVPEAVAEELAGRLERAFDLPRAASLACLRRSPPVARAAWRKTPYPDAPRSFAELLERSSLRAAERRFWTAIAAGETP